ncbi:hypothetical protein BDN72DRAFT_864684 [Pluteus cervinus]|uniref:Uncharacterized protein n=1 Tax=Pluteus cervinus TaxID=181527 RepID=A0ACD3A341_9AGAR|nr:hypothetical protein BDN72DRAFT_864684 [Pluteus cervinus]
MLNPNHSMLLVLFTFLVQAWAVPISGGPQTTPTVAHTLIWGIEPRSEGCGMPERTMLMVFRSCLLTIAACVYRAIHQNIPDPKAGWWRRQGIRMKITFFALMAPELMVWWAVRQWIGAKVVMEEVNKVRPGTLKLEWTRTHGHFAQMGGFGRFDDERILHPPTLVKLLQNGQIDVKELKRVTKKRIEDSSKGDILSKGIVALQTTWFVFECLARLQQKLPLLELEVVTLAFAALNIITYVLWWNKPLNVLCPIYLHVRPQPVFGLDGSNPSGFSANSLRSAEPVVDTNENKPLLGVGPVQEQKEGILGKAAITLEAAWKVVHEVVHAWAKWVKKDIDEYGWWFMLRWLIVDPVQAVAVSFDQLATDE